MSKVRVRVFGITEAKAEYSLYLMMLVEVMGTRKVPIIIGKFEAQSILVTMQQFNLQRPLPADVIVSIAKEAFLELVEVYIYKMEHDVFYAYLIYQKDDETILKIDARASDAIAVALRTGRPIYIEEEIIDRVQKNIAEERHSTINIENMSTEELDHLLEKAVDEEDYELAAKVRDELRKRQ